jgi:outer membrane protein OmpU
MKKILFGTSALVAAGAVVSSPAHAVEGGIQLGLGGYMNNFFSFGDRDDDDGLDFNETGLFSDGEVWFQGTVTLDNGIQFGANVQLESFTSGDQIDENYGWASGSFGRLQFGSENSAAYLMQYAAPNVGVPLNSGWITVFVAPALGTTTGGAFRHPSISTFGDYGNDENSITYFTPRFAGFQVGATYTPTITGTGDGANFPVQALEDVDGKNGFSVGANYVESFGTFDVAIAGGYRTATEVGGVDDFDQYSMGLNVGFSGFTVGGSFLWEDSDLATNGIGWDAGVSYATGPWAFGITYFQSQVSGTPGFNGDDELIALEGGVSYKIGPGITGSASVMWAEWDPQFSGTGTALDEDVAGLQGVLGINFRF